MSDPKEWPIVDVQEDPDAHREAVKKCLTDHLDAGEVDVTSIGKDPRSIIATCERCERKYWFETIEEAWIPGTDEYAEGPLGGGE